MDKRILLGTSKAQSGIELIKTPEVLITPTAYETLLQFIDAYPEEISGPGKVKRYEHTVLKGGFSAKRKEEESVDVYTILLIYDIFGVESFNMPAHTDAKLGFQNLYTDMIRRNEDTKDIRVWWHSHVGFGADWSSEDDETAFNFDCDFMVSIVGNKNQEFKVRLDIYDPVRISIDRIPFPKFHVSQDSPVRKIVDEQIKKYAKPDNMFGRISSNILGRREAHNVRPEKISAAT